MVDPKVTLTCPECGKQVSQGEKDKVPKTCPCCLRHVTWIVAVASNSK